jgi:hypothetical protein
MPTNSERARPWGPFTVEIETAIDAKPKWAEPCNGCGLCCLMQQCDLSIDLFGRQARCPALEQAGGRYACGLVTRPDHHLGVPIVAAPHFSHLFGDMLAVGEGCDSKPSWEI